MKSKFLIPVALPKLNGNEKKYVNDCLDSAWISSIGKYIKEFEEKFAKFIGVKHAISCCNGTVALHLSLLAHDIKSGDEIIVPTLTYIATVNAIRYCGATPIFVDSEPETWNIDPKKIEKKITKKTKGIIVAHLYGHPVDMDPIIKIAKKYKLFIIEDAAEAHGAKYKNKLVGSIGHIGTFSFFGNKIITTGEGGMVVTNNNKLAEKIRILKGQGMDQSRRYWFIKVGYNYRMTNIQAAIGLAQLEKIKWHMDMRKKVAKLYYQNLKPLSQFIELPIEKEWASHSFWMFSIFLKNSVNISRDKFMQLLQKEGIDTRPVFYPVTDMPPYKNTNDEFPVAKKISARGINLPTHAGLKKQDIQYIADIIKRYCFQFSK